MPEKAHQIPKENPQKSERKIEIRWMLLREGAFVQVRTEKGEGTEKIEKALLLFFPEVKMQRGAF